MLIAAIVYTLCVCFSSTVSVYTATILGDFADAVFSLDMLIGMENIKRLLICIITVVLIIPVFDLVARIITFKSALKHDRVVLSHFLDKEFQSVHKLEAGDIQYRLEWDACNLRLSWLEIISKVFMIPIAMIYLLYSAFQISWLFTIIVFCISIIKLSVPIAVRKIQSLYDKASREYGTKVRVYESSITERPYIIKLLGISHEFINKIDNLYKEYYKNVYRKSVRCSSIAGAISSSLDTFCMLLLLLIGAVMVANKSITAGAVAAMIGYFSIFNGIIGNIGYIIQNIPIMNNIAERLNVIYEDAEKTDGIEQENVNVIEAHNIAFSYDENNVFNNLNFKICKGNKSIIYGVNGSGKSTLIKIFCGLLKNYKGSLRLNTNELKDVSIESWRKQFSYAAQDPYLFSGSVKNNIWLGNLSADENTVINIMNKIGIGYLAEREVSMSQNDLSGGEKQKISIARALIKDTAFIILDEPSNNLDRDTSEWLCKFIIDSNKTVIFISHDIRLIKIADSEIVL